MKWCVAFFPMIAAIKTDPSVTMFLADSGRVASMWQDEKDFESGVSRVMQLQTNDLQDLFAHHPTSLLLETKTAIARMESLTDTINFAATTVNALDNDAKTNTLNACNFARSGALEAYATVNRLLHSLLTSLGTSCGCYGSGCTAQAIPETCQYPFAQYQALQSQDDLLWEQVKKTTTQCKIIGDISVENA